MKIQIPPRIRVEDYAQEDQELVGKLSGNISNFMDEVYRAINGGIDFENLTSKLIDVDIIISSSGALVNPPQAKNVTNSRLKGIVVVNAINLVNPGVYPTTTPFVSWTTTNNIINILNVTGLQNGSQYRLTLQLIV
jgi:hypothetical protein